jgi:hypothetical protein
MTIRKSIFFKFLCTKRALQHHQPLACHKIQAVIRRFFSSVVYFSCGPGSSVGIVTGYGLDGQGIESRWRGESFRTCPEWPWGPLSLLYNGYRVFPGGKERPGRDADPSLPSSVVVMKEQSYTSTPPMGRTACRVPQCLYKGALYLYFTLLFLEIPSLISSVDVLPSTGRMLYYVLNVQLFLQPQFTENVVDFVHWNAPIDL